MRASIRVFLLIFILLLAACDSSNDDPEPPPPLPTVAATAAPDDSQPDLATTIPDAATTATSIPSETPIPLPTTPPPPRTSGLAPAEETQVRFYHLIPELDAVNIGVQGLRLVSGLRFGRGTPLSVIEGGAYTINISISRDDTTVIEAPVELNAGENFTVILSGTLDAPELLTFAEDVSPLRGDETRVTLIHALPDGPAVELYKTGQPFLNAVNYGQQTAPAVTTSEETAFSLQSGTQTITAFNLDLDENDSVTVIVAPPELIAAGDDATPEAAPGTPQIITFETRSPGLAQARVINLTTAPVDAVPPQIDVYIDDILLTENLDYFRRSEPVDIGTQNTRLSVFPAGTDITTAEANISADVRVNSGDDITFIITGPLDDLNIITYEPDRDPVPADNARLTFVHALPGAPRTLPAINGTPLEIRPFGYGTISNSVTLTADTYSITWTVPEQNEDVEVLEASEGLQLEAGRSYLYLLTGAQEGQPVLIFSEVVDIDDALVEEGEAQQSLTSTVRVVNALNIGVPLDVYINEVAVANSLAFSTASLPNTLPEGEKAIAVRRAGEIGDLTVADFTLFSPNNYTIYIFGSGEADIQIAVAQETDLFLNEEDTTMRLINTTINGDGVYRLAYSPYTGPIFRPTPNPTTIAQGDSGMMPVRVEFVNVVQETEPQMVSSLGIVQVGTVNIWVIDTDENGIATFLENQTLQAGMHYDVFVQDSFELPEPAVFIISYPRW